MAGDTYPDIRIAEKDIAITRHHYQALREGAEVEMRFGITAGVDFRSGRIRVGARVEVRDTQRAPQEQLGLLELQFIFEAAHLVPLQQDTGRRTALISQLLPAFATIVFHTTRGIWFATSIGSWLADLPLPLVDPRSLLTRYSVEGEEEPA